MAGKAGLANNRLLVERALVGEGDERRVDPRAPGRGAKHGRRLIAARSATVNMAESPLGWLAARGLVDARQLDAGERLRSDWERAQIAPRVTMAWDAPPTGKVARGAPEPDDPTTARVSAKRRFEAAVAAVGPGLSDVLWRVVCAGEGMRDAERALGWPARAGRLVLGLALDRLAAFYRIG